jgi:hypothetical protein
MKPDRQSEFERIASENRRPNLIVEFWGFLRHNKKWWLLPILIMVIALGALIMLASTGVAPFIYTMF